MDDPGGSGTHPPLHSAPHAPLLDLMSSQGYAEEDRLINLGSGRGGSASIRIGDASGRAGPYDEFVDQMLKPFPGAGGSAAARSPTSGMKWIRWHGSVLPRVWYVVLLWTFWAAIVVVVAELGNLRDRLAFPSQGIVNLTGFAAALLLGFRTNSAYERWYEGRRVFEVACGKIRDLVRTWTVARPAKSETERLKQLGACRCAVAYLYALMYHVRDEDPLAHADCADLIPRSRSGGFALESHDRNGLFSFEKTPAVIQISGFSQRRLGRSLTAFKLPGTWSDTRTFAVPGQLVALMTAYDTADGTQSGTASGALSDLAATQAALERILSTPMPPVYTIHLRMILSIFFFFLPFQFLDWGFLGILLMAVSAFVLWGFEVMGLELENPFGYDANDLPLGEICATLRREIEFMVGHPVVRTDDWVVESVALP
ncbi:Bestrophin, RFP-TM, chloride channel-domain-containing protein [Hyaloraphidium curvatum]|nr:Bestrophin, RFP-TM, chloride channel-domain-containing protein [Hyaloraphidium curvatum]